MTSSPVERASQLRATPSSTASSAFFAGSSQGSPRQGTASRRASLSGISGMPTSTPEMTVTSPLTSEILRSLPTEVTNVLKSYDLTPVDVISVASSNGLTQPIAIKVSDPEGQQAYLDIGQSLPSLSSFTAPSATRVVPIRTGTSLSVPSGTKSGQASTELTEAERILNGLRKAGYEVSGYVTECENDFCVVHDLSGKTIENYYTKISPETGRAAQAVPLIGLPTIMTTQPEKLRKSLVGAYGSLAEQTAAQQQRTLQQSINSINKLTAEIDRFMREREGISRRIAEAAKKLKSYKAILAAKKELSPDDVYKRDKIAANLKALRSKIAELNDRTADVTDPLKALEQYASSVAKVTESLPATFADIGKDLT